MLTVITGCMFSGKSTRLLSIARAHSIAGKKVGLFKPINDKRYSNCKISTHDGAGVLCHTLEQDAPGKSIAMVNYGIEVFAFDEAQFFDSKYFIYTVERLVYIHGVEVIISGLAQDSSGKPFGAMGHLLAIADDIIHLKAVCSATKEIGAATRTFRKVDSQEQIVVGGIEIYEPRSFKQWIVRN